MGHVVCDLAQYCPASSLSSELRLDHIKPCRGLQGFELDPEAWEAAEDVPDLEIMDQWEASGQAAFIGNQNAPSTTAHEQQE